VKGWSQFAGIGGGFFSRAQNLDKRHTACAPNFLACGALINANQNSARLEFLFSDIHHFVPIQHYFEDFFCPS
jgi:hypothetical protein